MEMLGCEKKNLTCFGNMQPRLNNAIANLDAEDRELLVVNGRQGGSETFVGRHVLIFCLGK